MRMKNQESPMRHKRHHGIAVIELKKILYVETFRLEILLSFPVVVDDTVPNSVVETHLGSLSK